MRDLLNQNTKVSWVTVTLTQKKLLEKKTEKNLKFEDHIWNGAYGNTWLFLKKLKKMIIFLKIHL